MLNVGFCGTGNKTQLQLHSVVNKHKLSRSMFQNVKVSMIYVCTKCDCCRCVIFKVSESMVVQHNNASKVIGSTSETSKLLIKTSTFIVHHLSSSTRIASKVWHDLYCI